MRHPVLALTVALALLFLIAGGLMMVIAHIPTPAPLHTPATVDPYAPGSIGYFTEHGNPVCALLYSYPDPEEPGVTVTVITMIPYYGKHPGKRWDPTHREMPRKQAEKMCRSLGGLLWHP